MFLYATDRFIAVETYVGKTDCEDAHLYFTQDTLKTVCAFPPSSRVGAVRQSLQVDSAGVANTFKSVEIDFDAPDIKKLIDMAWGDQGYFTPGDDIEPYGLDVGQVKHIRGCVFVPRLNRAGGGIRFQAPGRVRGIVAHTRLKEGKN
ncbi:hypothetical protein [Corynebacterium urealyticum]|uniref:hypothetical protein n=1 Tax=Corynebacterium urealyticum TaxID=43771 RepID=UPI00293E4161|nr:hypothetical protein [Corynebacterium urealyticum]WOH94953.1 hypothetical protein RZ943_02870 [Corynebacterium urealyticum]